MKQHLILFFHQFIRFFFLLTPFFALSVFLSMTRGHSERNRKKTAVMVTLSVSIICFVLFLFGNYIFDLFGITIDAFRIGAGALLFLTAISLSQGKNYDINNETDSDMVVVPLSIPIIAGPATIGTILIMSAESAQYFVKIVSFSALLVAIICVGLILLISSFLERVLHTRGILILSKITGLILAAIASQMIFTGIRSFMK
jgi:multiple antibiotic resistance protein